MIEALVTGKLLKDAEQKTSGTGKEYALLVVRESEERLIRVLLWDDVDRMSRLKKGDAVAVVGSLTVSIWEGKPSLSLMAHRAMTAGERKPKPDRPREKPDTPSQAAYRAAAHAQRADGDLPSDLPW